MADRIYKGKLLPEETETFPEASKSFDKPHSGGLVPFALLQEVLMIRDPEKGYGATDIAEHKMIDGSLWLSRGDVWIKIDPDGSIEVGTSGV